MVTDILRRQYQKQTYRNRNVHKMYVAVVKGYNQFWWFNNFCTFFDISMIKCDDFVEDDEVEDVRDVGKGGEGRVVEIDDLSRVFYQLKLN